jgi:hypothetical protein
VEEGQLSKGEVSKGMKQIKESAMMRRERNMKRDDE